MNRNLFICAWLQLRTSIFDPSVDAGANRPPESFIEGEELKKHDIQNNSYASQRNRKREPEDADIPVRR
jgi:hypothetical protein